LCGGVDVLSLSATPIPRTLQMALAGVRAMTIMDTPPAHRKPVITTVQPYDGQVGRSARVDCPRSLRGVVWCGAVPLPPPLLLPGRCVIVCLCVLCVLARRWERRCLRRWRGGGRCSTSWHALRTSLNTSTSSGTAEIRQFGVMSVYRTKSPRCQNTWGDGRREGVKRGGGRCSMSWHALRTYHSTSTS
jgi:hypothetical protein